jgi:hypothetical protein
MPFRAADDGQLERSFVLDTIERRVEGVDPVHRFAGGRDDQVALLEAGTGCGTLGSHGADQYSILLG